ncbi:MAG: cation transporter [Thermomicrobiales bacterium]
MSSPQTPQQSPQAVLLHRGLRLEYATLGWNVVGSVVVVISALAAHSVALAGFGLDSLIEIVASLVVVWELKGINQRRERRALRPIGGAFVALAIYLLLQAAYTLVNGAHPRHSPVGIVWLAATFIAMLALAWAKGRTGGELGTRVLLTESRVTLVDAYLAGAVLAGLVLNSVFGWWWADPLAGLVHRLLRRPGRVGRLA